MARACSPARNPLCAPPDFSNNPEYWLILSGVKGGTRRPWPLTWGCIAEGGGPGGGRIAEPGAPPSNLGNGPGRNASSGVGLLPA